MKMYFAAMVLPESINKKIVPLKEHMLEKYRCRVGLRSPAHITLISPFWMDEVKEQQFTTDIKQVSTDIQPFSLSTNNFSAFRPRTIFIGVKPSEQLDAVKKAIDTHFASRDYKVKIDDRPFHPHITIATRDLHKKAFQEAWPLFAEKEFNEEWIADSISVLRHNGECWDVIFTSEFGG